MATYYVRSSGGNDSNAGTSFALGWATVGKAASTVTQGDTVIICADGTHDVGTGADFSTNGNYILVTGADATGNVDGTKATVQATAAGTDVLTMGANQHIMHLNIDGNNQATDCIQ